MAEHDWYEKHKKDVAAALKKGRVAVKDDGVACTLVKMKDGSTLLCSNISSSKAAALVKEAKSEGGKVLSAGKLYSGEDGATFAVSEGSTSVKTQFMAAALEAGTALKVTVVADTPPEEAAVPAAPPTDGAPAVVEDDKSRFTALLRQVRPIFQQAIAGEPPNKATLEKAMSLVVAAAKESDFGKAIKVLQALDLSLKKTPTAADTTPPPAPTPAPAAAAPATATIQAALAKMIPLIKDAAAANPARKSDLLEPLKRCQDHLKNGLAVEAKVALFDLNRVLKELNGQAPPAAEKAPTSASEGEGEEGQATTVGVWVDARDKVVAQMQALQAALVKEAQETGDADYSLIANKGLAGITKRLQVGLHVALLEFDRASGDARATARTKAHTVVKDFQTFLGTDGLVKLAENNPWNIKVEISATLGAALERLSKTLSA